MQNHRDRFAEAAMARGYSLSAGAQLDGKWQVAQSQSSYTMISRNGCTLSVRLADHDCGIDRGRSYHLYLTTPLSPSQISSALDQADALVTQAVAQRDKKRVAEIARQEAALRRGNLHLAIDIEMKLRGWRGKDQRAIVSREMEERHARI